MWQGILDAAGTYFGVPGVGSLLGSLGGSSGSSNRYATEANREAFAYNTGEANKARDFLSVEAATNRNWQQNMADTSYQRATADMQAAGLNPMLAYQQGGARQSGGGQASGGQAAAGPSGHGGASEVERAQAANLRADAQVKMAQIPLMQAQTDKETSSAAHARAQTSQVEAIIPKIREEIKLIQNQAHVSHVDAQLRARQAVLSDAQHDLARTEEKLRKQQISESQAREEVERAVAKLRNLDIPRAANEAGTQDTWWKKNIAPYLKDFQGTANSAGSVLRIIGK